MKYNFALLESYMVLFCKSRQDDFMDEKELDILSPALLSDLTSVCLIKTN